MSSRPMVISRGRSAGSTSNTVLRPFGVAVGGDHAGRLVEQEQPRPLDRRDLHAVELDDVVGASTLKAGEVSTLPLTLTRPAAISSSASRREAMPARASRLAMRSPGSSAASPVRGRGLRSPLGLKPSRFGRLNGLRSPCGSRRGGRNCVHLRLRGGHRRRRRASHRACSARPSTFSNGLSPRARPRRIGVVRAPGRSIARRALRIVARTGRRGLKSRFGARLAAAPSPSRFGRRASLGASLRKSLLERLVATRRPLAKRLVGALAGRVPPRFLRPLARAEITLRAFARGARPPRALYERLLARAGAQACRQCGLPALAGTGSAAAWSGRFWPASCAGISCRSSSMWPLPFARVDNRIV